MKKRYLSMVIFLLVFINSWAQLKSSDELKEKLKKVNSQIADSFLRKDFSAITNLYDDNEPACMPEYHKALYTKEDIKSYYQQWLSKFTINSYKRDIYEIQQIGNYAVEIGTFNIHSTNQNGAVLVYDGKYLNVWKVEKNGKLILESEIWGANKAIDGSNFASIKTKESEMPKPKINKTLETEVGKRNERIAELVSKREGEKHAVEFFTKDAIYLTYDAPMFVGIENIKPYFEEHEKPNGVSIDSISIKAGKMIPINNFVIEYGYYYVDVSWDNKKGRAIVTGKSTNVWKRDENGVLMLFRQMVNHN
ncbi:nuclear transport factor 2 family protein [Flavobacterium sp. KACC 22758]|uniref:nuclear transport factor 2 family protein n=1 Tax=Flavobacterium sp. KACC 22758 TaxID=3025667 RepID=UPI002364FF66|nr:nuclear transport factor 2 family protein [Flavobacterium sp. KACC 22758]WDF57918.1 nuclear transport factor 2 family protein [Flavobacterium sp. KACC 22758]